MAYCLKQIGVKDTNGFPVNVFAIDGGNAPPTCPSGFVVYSNTDYTNATVLEPASLGIDADSISAVFGWAFAAIIFFWSIGFCIGVVLDVIRKA